MFIIYFGGGGSGLLVTVLIFLVSLGPQNWIFDVLSALYQQCRGLFPQDSSTVVGTNDFTWHVRTNLLWCTLISVSLASIIALLFIEGQGQGLLVGARRLYRKVQLLFSNVDLGRGTATAPTNQSSLFTSGTRFDQVVQAIQRLPLEVYMTKEDLQGLPLRALKAKLIERGLARQGELLDKETAIANILAAGGSSSGTCSICCEDYQSEDVLRVLRCNHRFHVACVDQWFLSSSTTSMHVACPFCNTPLLQDAA
eukprot:jgi/Botrbrau1/16164/Bobra.0272s0002.1